PKTMTTEQQHQNKTPKQDTIMTTSGQKNQNDDDTRARTPK
ncbi:1476_t:CDS:1, partial [Racocetra persica]